VRVRVRLPGAFVYFSLAFILGTFSGLAGPLSVFASVILPFLFASSAAHLLLSRHYFNFHQSFSTDHPRKGETVRYELRMANDGPLPSAFGVCRFSDPGPLGAFRSDVPVPVSANRIEVYEETLRCSWWGTYVVGLVSVTFRDALGILEIEERVEPRVFYVYPELVRLDDSIESLALSSGADKPGAAAGRDDSSIFEYLDPLRPGRPARRVAWKRWAASGVPAEIVHGQSRSSGLKVVLDLWRGKRRTLGKLASEDAAVSAVFSVLQYLAEEGIPAELELGAEGPAVPVHSAEDFDRLFERSTNITFSEETIPAGAFAPGPAVLLVTTRPLAAPGPDGADLYALYEAALAAGCEPHLLLCPPPENHAAERRVLESLGELQQAAGGRGLLRCADTSNGTGDLFHALCR
jgi:uncharacterized protein (DUF58 family)